MASATFSACLAPTHCWNHPIPDVTTRVCPGGWVCQALRAKALVMLAQLGDVLIGAVAVEVDLGQLRLEEGIFLVGEVDIGCAEVLLDAFEFARSAGRDDELGLVQHPCKRSAPESRSFRWRSR